MSTYSTQRAVERPDRASDPLDLLIEFFRANGYELLDRERDPEDKQIRETVILTRGEEAAGWWSSDMSKLPSRVEIEHDVDDEIRAQYEIDVRGQHLTDEDREFWRRELSAAFDYLRNPSRTPRDLQHEEAKRAEHIRRRMLTYGIWGAILAFLLILMLQMFATRF